MTAADQATAPIPKTLRGIVSRVIDEYVEQYNGEPTHFDDLADSILRALLDDAEGREQLTIVNLTRQLKSAKHLEHMATRHALKAEADEAEAYAKLVQRDADVARLEARERQQNLEIHDLREQVRRVRDLCADALADPGDTNGGGWEDPTPIPGWTTAVLNALGEEEEQR